MARQLRSRYTAWIPLSGDSGLDDVQARFSGLHPGSKLVTAAVYVERQIEQCDLCVHGQLAQRDSRTIPKPALTLKGQLHRVCGVDLTKIPGIKEQVAQVIISEVGLDMTKWNTEKQFSSFLGLCPDNSIGGGKVLPRSARKVYNRAADTLRLCAQSVTHRKSALGAQYRRLRARLGAPKAIVAMADHLARLVYRMLRYGQRYVEKGIHQYELIPSPTHQSRHCTTEGRKEPKPRGYRFISRGV